MVLVVKVIVSEIGEKAANVVYTGRVRNIYVNIYLYKFLLILVLFIIKTTVIMT